MILFDRHAMRLLLVLLLASVCLAGPVSADAPSGTFLAVKAKTFSKDKFTFPASLKGARLNVLFLAMSEDRDNGQYQQEALLAWHAALESAGAFADDILAYHFPVLESPPFFVKGIIASAMRDSYKGKVPLEQAGVLYVDDLEAFAAAAELKLDARPTIVITAADGRPLHSVKGEVSPEGVQSLIAAIQAHSR